MTGRVLVVAGSDSGGGAGIQADIKTIMALGGYATTALTAITAQNTLGVSAVTAVSPALVRQQIDAVLGDIGADAIKTGMLVNAEIVGEVADALAARLTPLPFVLDPVMIAKGGAILIDDAAIDAMRTRLFPLATVLTPNLPEAETLLGRAIINLATMREAAQMLRRQGPAVVLLKGGHLAGAQVHDVLATMDEITVFTAERFETRHTHGTGCTLASAIAAGLALGHSLADSVIRARAYVRGAIRTAPGLGRGHGPLNHAAGLQTAATSSQ